MHSGLKGPQSKWCLAEQSLNWTTHWGFCLSKRHSCKCVKLPFMTHRATKECLPQRAFLSIVLTTLFLFTLATCLSAQLNTWLSQITLPSPKNVQQLGLENIGCHSTHKQFQDSYSCPNVFCVWPTYTGLTFFFFLRVLKKIKIFSVHEMLLFLSRF